MQIDFGLSSGPQFVKIDARTGCFRVREDGQDISFTELTAAFDLFHVRLGWFAFTKNGISFVKGVKAPQPAAIDGAEYKQGLSVRLISPDQPAGCAEALGERELTSTSIVVRRAFAELYREALAQACKLYGEVMAEADGLNSAWPVVHCDGFRQVKAAKGIAYAPIMRVIDWEMPIAADAGGPEF
jgi:hypothetical protein